MGEDVLTAVERLQTAVSEFRTYIRSLPAERLRHKAWGARETLAHLVFWLERYVTQAEALLAGEKVMLVNGRFDDLNLQFIAEHEHVPVENWLARHQSACDYLCDVVQQPDSAQLILTLKKASSFQHTLLHYLTEEAGHIRAHLAARQKQDARGYMPDITALKRLGQQFAANIRAGLNAQTGGNLSKIKQVLAELAAVQENFLTQIKAQLPESENQDGSANPSAGKDETLVKDTPCALLHQFLNANEQLCALAEMADPQTILLTVNNHTATLDFAVAHIHADSSRRIKPWQ
jgi:hypothetical protein